MCDCLSSSIQSLWKNHILVECDRLSGTQTHSYMNLDIDYRLARGERVDWKKYIIWQVVSPFSSRFKELSSYTLTREKFGGDGIFHFARNYDRIDHVLQDVWLSMKRRHFAQSNLLFLDFHALDRFRLAFASFSESHRKVNRGKIII